MSLAITSIGLSRIGDSRGTPLAGDALVRDGGVTSAISASEVRVPGRPRDPEGSRRPPSPRSGRARTTGPAA